MAETFLSFSIETARFELRRIYTVSKVSATPLGQALAAEYARISSVTSSGLIPSATSANAHSVSFSTPDNAGTSPTALQSMWGWLLDLYDELAAVLPPPVTDEAIYVEMRSHLLPARTAANSYLGLRYA